MLRLILDKADQATFKILCLGAHPDDIEIGCGGTILRLLTEHPNLEFYWAVFSATSEREPEARKSAQLFLRGAQRQTIIVQHFRDGFFPFVGSEIKEVFEQLKTAIAPDVILTHYRHDLHQDHRVISDLTWNTFRNHLILEYEIPKYDGDLGSPNCFVHLDESLCQKKIHNLIRVFQSQKDKPWFTEDVFRGLMRLRGVESNAPEKYAEGFYCRKLVL